MCEQFWSLWSNWLCLFWSHSHHSCACQEVLGQEFLIGSLSTVSQPLQVTTGHLWMIQGGRRSTRIVSQSLNLPKGWILHEVSRVQMLWNYCKLVSQQHLHIVHFLKQLFFLLFFTRTHSGTGQALNYGEQDHYWWVHGIGRHLSHYPRGVEGVRDWV